MSSVKALHELIEGFSKVHEVDVFEEIEPTLIPFNGSSFDSPKSLLSNEFLCSIDGNPEDATIYDSILVLVETPGSMNNHPSFGLVCSARARKLENVNETTSVVLYIWVPSPIVMESAVWRESDNLFEISEATDSEGPLHHALKLLSIRAAIDSMTKPDSAVNNSDAVQSMEKALQNGVVAFRKMMKSFD